VAGIISLLNDCLLWRGEKPLGFANPWLYGLAVVGMNDITLGSNPGCGTEGFSAIAGWDPVRPAKLMYLQLRFGLIFGLVGDGTRNAGLFKHASHN
jgi:hypothetical protein